MAFVFALLAGPGDPLNWIVGMMLAASLAAAIFGLRAAGTTQPARLLLLPWYIFGVAVLTAKGTAELARFLLTPREWRKVGLMSCPAIAEAEKSRMLLALAETISPGSVVIGTGDELQMSAIDADAPASHCEELRGWYARFLRPMAK